MNLNCTLGNSHPPPSLAPPHWATSCTHQECSLHQLSPYIGKLKSVIARDLILAYSKPGDLVADVFCGSGTVPLEAARHGRRVFACDTSTYAITLTKGKLNAPADVASAHRTLDEALELSQQSRTPDLRSAPQWVRAFFHPKTLKDSLRLARVLRDREEHFLLAALLGILHHQRPGFLSHPSSHLIPYLRTKRFPRSQFPELYEYRSLRPRLRAKLERALRRVSSPTVAEAIVDVQQTPAQKARLPEDIDCVITSPPYMNALDYRRDNRLRLWFLGETCTDARDRAFGTISDFSKLIGSVATRLARHIRPGGYCVFVVGDKTLRGGRAYPSQILQDIFADADSGFALEQIVADTIPDVRRSRRNAAGVTKEHILVFRRVTRAA